MYLQRNYPHIMNVGLLAFLLTSAMASLARAEDDLVRELVVSPSSKQQNIPPANLAVLQSVIGKLQSNPTLQRNTNLKESNHDVYWTVKKYSRQDYSTYELFPHSKLLHQEESAWSKQFTIVEKYKAASAKFLDLAAAKYLPGDIVMVKTESTKKPLVLVYSGELEFPDESNPSHERSFLIFPYGTRTGMEFNTFPPRWQRTLLANYAPLKIRRLRPSDFVHDLNPVTGAPIDWLKTPYGGSVLVPVEWSEFQVLRLRPDGILIVTARELTSIGEGSDSQTKHIHWPRTLASGVTIGKGYDMGGRTAPQVIRELTAAGMRIEQATKISKGAGKTGKNDEARIFVRDNQSDIGEIPLTVQRNLLAQILDVKRAEAEADATSTIADTKNINAAGRERKEKKPTGTYVMSKTEWSNLHEAMIEFLTDLKYQGQYYGYDRIAKINAKLKANDGKVLEQFKSVRELFRTNYMDNYAAEIGEQKGGKGATGTWYGQKVNYGGKYKRKAIRLAYLNHVIDALEAGKLVVVVQP